jgi:hypothetical protein
VFKDSVKFDTVKKEDEEQDELISSLTLSNSVKGPPRSREYLAVGNFEKACKLRFDCLTD